MYKTIIHVDKARSLKKCFFLYRENLFNLKSKKKLT